MSHNQEKIVYRTNVNQENFDLVTVLKPLTSAQISALKAGGEFEKIIDHMESYTKQQERIRNKEFNLGRLTCKVNKADGLYVAHPSFSQVGGGLNFNKFLLPAIEALCFDDRFRELVSKWFEYGLEIDTNYLKEKK